ncbi:MAG TPA: hypothetical protein VI231_04150, partial [Candidatus Binatia bacterium]
SIVPIDLPRPRGFKTMQDPDFIKCLERIWDLLRSEVDRAMRENHRSGPEEEAPPRRKSIFDWW